MLYSLPVRFKSYETKLIGLHFPSALPAAELTGSAETAGNAVAAGRAVAANNAMSESSGVTVSSAVSADNAMSDNSVVTDSSAVGAGSKVPPAVQFPNISAAIFSCALSIMLLTVQCLL